MPISKSTIVEDFILSPDGQYIYVDYFDKNEYKNSTYTVIRGVFEQWLQHENRLDWVIDHCNNGEHQQYAGVAAIDDYWQNAEYDLKLKDLKDYMIAASGESQKNS